jgi:hypothetical protein
MSATIIPFDVDHPRFYGLKCPICGQGRWLTVRTWHWVVCDRHKLKDLRGGRFLEPVLDEEDARRNRALLDGYSDARFSRPAVIDWDDAS